MHNEEVERQQIVEEDIEDPLPLSSEPEEDLQRVPRGIERESPPPPEEPEREESPIPPPD